MSHLNARLHKSVFTRWLNTRGEAPPEHERGPAERHATSNDTLTPLTLSEYLSQSTPITSRSRARRERTYHGPCATCHRLLEATITLAQPYLNRNRTADGNFFWRSYEADLKIDKLESSASSCGICDILLAIIRGSDGLVLRQTKDYDNPTFNPFDVYHDDGVSDIDSYVRGKSSKVKIQLCANLDGPSADGRSSQLLLHFDLHFQTQISMFEPHPTIHTRLEAALPIFLLDKVEEASNDDYMAYLSYDSRPEAESKLSLIGAWLDSTQEADHEVMPDGLPKRLLDLTRGRVIKLIECQNLHRDRASIRSIQYVALSHRWGASQHLTTTKRTLNRMHKGIEVDRLPKTFQDAVFLCQFLGFTYLWIDALCIIQDSSPDWQQESQKMGDIFKNAQVTFAAHCAADDSEGFLHASLQKRSTYEDSVQEHRVAVCRPYDAERDITNSGLSRRGWVLQERFLSTRTIHFTSGHIYLESAAGILFDDGTSDSSRSNDLSDDPTSLKRYNPPRSLYSPSAFPKLQHLLKLDWHQTLKVNWSTDRGTIRNTTSEWLELVEMYSHCDLTQESDKLMAISGMARKIARITNQTWAAGIWSDNICKGLLWFPTDEELTAPVQPRAPTWSWASQDGVLQYSLAPKLAGYVDRCSFHSIEDTQGRIVNWLDGPGRLTLRGRLIPIPSYYEGEPSRIGPGPPRKGDITTVSKHELPRLPLKKYMTIRPVRTIKEESHVWNTRGWIAVETKNRVFSRRSFSLDTMPPETSEWFLILGTREPDVKEPPTSERRFHIEERSDKAAEDCVLCVGIFLTPSKDGKGRTYTRYGAGQLAWSFVTQAHKLRIATGSHQASSSADAPWEDYLKGKLSPRSLEPRGTRRSDGLEWFFAEDKLENVTIE